MIRGSSLKLTVPLLVLLLAILAFAVFPCQRYHYLEDPALSVDDPSLCIGDEWDRRAAEIIRALERDKEDEEARTWLLWLLRARKAPAPVILSGGMRGYQDHVTVATGIHDLFVEEHREHIEKAYAGGDATGRAAIGETFYRHQTPMPWAEPLILKGLSDPDRKVRACFAKGTLLLRPFSKQVRARLEAMAGEEPNAAWALSIVDRDESEDR